MIESTHVPGQQYSLEQISFVVQALILNARTGFRGASRVMGSVARMFGLNREVPHHDLALWSEYQTLLEASVDEIRRHGYSRSSAFQVALRVQPHVQTIAGRELKDQLLKFIAEESASIAPGERLPGSSEPLESSNNL